MRAVPAANLPLLRRFEQAPHGGFASTPYRDPANFWTIGWGHLMSTPYDASIPNPVSQAQADALAEQDLANTAQDLWTELGEAPVNLLSESQWAALIDFTFNEGIGHFATSTMHHLIQLNMLNHVAAEFPKWVYGGRPSVKLPGLILRRAAEQSLWLQ